MKTEICQGAENGNAQEGRFSLREILPQISGGVELVIEDEFADGEADQFRIISDCGESLMRKLDRSRIVDGKSILEMIPELKSSGIFVLISVRNRQ